MRSLFRLALSVSLAAMVASLAMAQPGFAGVKKGTASAMLFRAMIGNSVAVLLSKGVQEELKMEDAQATKVKGLWDTLWKKMEESRSGRDMREINKKMEDWWSQGGFQEADALVAPLLKPAQAKRLNELSLQRRGVQALTDPALQKALTLTDAQKRAINSITAEEEEKWDELTKTPGGKLAERRAKHEQLRKQSDDKAFALLTAAQMKIWKAMTGKPFKLPGKAAEKDRGKQAGQVEGGTLRATIEKVDPEERVITVTRLGKLVGGLGSSRGGAGVFKNNARLENLPVAKAARILLNGKKADLKDLKPEMSVSLKLVVKGDITVQEIEAKDR